jgi:1,2-diacylglycerol 3-beta-galactosyltransferase
MAPGRREAGPRGAAGAELVAQRGTRFLFLISDTGGGHRASAQAVKAEMARLYGAKASVEIVDVFVEMARWPFDRFPDWYPTCVSLNGIAWGVGFHLSNGVRVFKAMSKLFWPYARTPFCDVLRRHRADVIVSFHPIPNSALFLAMLSMGWEVPVAFVAVDLVTAHAGWFVPGADTYLVPTPGAKERAVRWGNAPESVHVTGMPIRRPFLASVALSRSEARAAVGLPDDGPVVLIVGGGEGMGPLAQVVRAIANQRPSAHIVVITGRNAALYQDLSSDPFPIPVQVEGFVDNMDVWMRAADVLVTKAGPNTLAEAFIAGLPLVLYTALPGQEEGNVDLVVRHGAGVWAPLPRQCARAVVQLLEDLELRSHMAARSRALARPRATEQIARALWDLSMPTGRSGQGDPHPSVHSGAPKNTTRATWT